MIFLSHKCRCGPCSFSAFTKELPVTVEACWVSELILEEYFSPVCIRITFSIYKNINCMKWNPFSIFLHKPQFLFCVALAVCLHWGIITPDAVELAVPSRKCWEEENARVLNLGELQWTISSVGKKNKFISHGTFPQLVRLDVFGVQHIYFALFFFV